MFVKINNEEYAISFKRNPNAKTTTVCIIEKIVGENRIDMGHGFSKMWHKDNYCKETGRQFALVRAIEDAAFTKENKSIIINTYRNWGKKRDINYGIFW